MEADLGLVYADLRLSNVARADLDEVDARALVDTGAMHLCIPRHLAIQLDLQAYEKREVTTADGTSHVVDYVGPVRVEMFGRSCFTGALVLGDTVLLGAIPMEDMDLIVEPAGQRVLPNPANPNIPLSIAKGLRPR
jgi:clan AA aspartic protease